MYVPITEPESQASPLKTTEAYRGLSQGTSWRNVPGGPGYVEIPFPKGTYATWKPEWAEPGLNRRPKDFQSEARRH